MPPTRKWFNQHYSNIAEDYVTTLAVLRGWNILARNYRRPRCELDIIMEREGMLSIVEVKLRSGPFTLDSVLSPAKRLALVRGANQFLAESMHGANTIRFDLAVVGIMRGKPHLRTYIADVFQA